MGRFLGVNLGVTTEPKGPCRGKRSPVFSPVLPPGIEGPSITRTEGPSIRGACGSEDHADRGSFDQRDRWSGDRGTPRLLVQAVQALQRAWRSCGSRSALGRSILSGTSGERLDRDPVAFTGACDVADEQGDDRGGEGKGPSMGKGPSIKRPRRKITPLSYSRRIRTAFDRISTTKTTMTISVMGTVSI